jgi:hypothetical protein
MMNGCRSEPVIMAEFRARGVYSVAERDLVVGTEG